MNDNTIEIVFEITRHDFLHGTRYLSKNFPSQRKVKRVMYFLLFLASLINVNKIYRDDGVAVAIFYVLLAFGFLLAVTSLFGKLASEYIIRKMAPKDTDSGILGEHHLTITSEYIIERTRVDETKFLWKSVPKIDEDKEYIYLFQTPLSAHTIPKRIFDDEGTVRFMNKLRLFKQMAEYE